MKFSVVTISYNHARFLERTIRSVIEQTGVDFEYIIVDPGSKDGSRDIIERYRSAFAAVILEPEKGPGDGHNNGFALATGDILFYLNSDDTIEPGAFAAAHREFERDPDLDVLCAHGWVIDAQDKRLRRIWSDPYSPAVQAYGAAIQIQPSTYIRARSFRKVGGFNVENRTNWDGELFVDLCLSGAKVKIINAFLSNYRIHDESITGGGVSDGIRRWRQRQFRAIMGREWTDRDKYAGFAWRLYRQVRNPRAFLERLRHGAFPKR